MLGERGQENQTELSEWHKTLIFPLYVIPVLIDNQQEATRKSLLSGIFVMKSTVSDKKFETANLLSLYHLYTSLHHKDILRT